MLSRGVATVVVALSLIAAPAQAQSFDFESQTIGASTPFSATSGGLTATFASSGSPFVIGSSFFSSLTGQVLLDADFAHNVLSIQFSNPLTSIFLNFATNGFGSFSLAAFLGSAGVGGSTTTGSVPSGFTFPEGTISFSGGTFDRIDLSATTQDFAIDNISVVQGTVTPEPATITLMASGLLLTALAARRRRSGAV